MSSKTGFDADFWRRTIERTIVIPGAQAVTHKGNFVAERQCFQIRAEGWEEAQIDPAKATTMMARVGVALGDVLAKAAAPTGGVFFEIEQIELVQDPVTLGWSIRGLMAWNASTR